ncbi:hypothetical protein FB451DRAFT_1387411 [Mycena latifolia]|nr:hypothetical protein FB451DRAFT_1387411 [Mycena latifolia]
MVVTYGIRVQPSNDMYITLAHTAVQPSALAAVPGRFLNSLPCLKYIQSWFPGAGFKRQANEWKKLARELIDRPLRRQSATWCDSGIAPRSFTAEHLYGLRDQDTY